MLFFIIIIFIFETGIAVAGINDEVQTCEGETAVLSWQVSYFNYTSLMFWKKGNDVIAKLQPPSSIQMEPEYSNNLKVYIKEMDGEINLHILKVSDLDVDTYECTAFFKDGKPKFNKRKILSLKRQSSGCKLTHMDEKTTCLTLQCDVNETNVFIQNRTADQVSNNTYRICNISVLTSSVSYCVDSKYYCKNCTEITISMIQHDRDSETSFIIHIIVFVMGSFVIILATLMSIFVYKRGKGKLKKKVVQSRDVEILPLSGDNSNLLEVTQPDTTSEQLQVCQPIVSAGNKPK